MILHAKLIFLVTAAIILGIINSISAQDPEPVEVECNTVWQKSIIGGWSLGGMGMEMADYNGNGLDEIILANGNTFNIVEYSPSSESYDVIWGSKYYESLQKLLIADVDNDGSKEILIGYNDHYIDLYDLLSHELKDRYTIDVSIYYEDREVIVADANNDGLNELILLIDDVITMYSINNDTCVKIFEMNEECNRIRCGDVDGDSLNEVVLNNGRVHRIINGQAEFLWTFRSGYHSFTEIEVADVDGDNIDEIISLAYKIEVFDGDTHTIKWPYATLAVGYALTIADTDGTGLPEILYVDLEYEGNTICIDAFDGSQRWRLQSPYVDAITLLVGDTDDDGNKEIASASCYDSSPDHLIIYQINNLDFEYSNIADNGDYKVIRVADIDNDNRNELITISGGSELWGPGVITVYDAETKQLEWTNHTFIPINNLSGEYDMEIADIDHDGDLEMVILSNVYYAHAISVINGRTHHLDASRVGDPETFNWPATDLTIADLDSDGTFEFVTITEDSLWIINSETFQRIKYITSYLSDDFACPVAGNIDNDSNTELVFLKDSLYVMDGLIEETWTVGFFPHDQLLVCLLYDFDMDGRDDIIVSTSSGTIYCIDGITRQPVLIANTGLPIHELHLADITGDASPEFIFTSSNKLYVMHSDGSIEFTQTGAYNYYYLSIEISDYNNDGNKEIFIGSDFCVQEFDAMCFDYCNNLSANVVTYNASCAGSDGSAEVITTGGTQPFSFLWSTGDTTATAEGLAAGTYLVTLTDSMGCPFSLDVAIGAFEFLIDSIITAPDILNTVECEGSAALSTTYGTPPYTIFIEGHWTNLSDSVVTGLCEAAYPVLLQDANGCIADTIINIESVVGLPENDDPLFFNIYPNPTNESAWLQTGITPKTGTLAKISTPFGVLLNQIEITGQRTRLDISNLPKGIYLVTLSNNGGVWTGKLVVE